MIFETGQDREIAAIKKELVCAFFWSNYEYRYYEIYADMFSKDNELCLLQLYPIATRFVTDLTTNITSVYEDPINGMKIKNCDNTSGTYLGDFGIPVPGSENAK